MKLDYLENSLSSHNAAAYILRLSGIEAKSSVSRPEHLRHGYTSSFKPLRACISMLFRFGTLFPIGWLLNRFLKVLHWSQSWSQRRLWYCPQLFGHSGFFQTSFQSSLLPMSHPCLDYEEVTFIWTAVGSIHVM